MEDVRRTTESLKRKKTCGEGGVVAKMYQDTESLGWHRACAFNTRLMNYDGGEWLADVCRDEFRVRLLGKKSAPTSFTLLRPIALLPRSAKL